MLFLMAPFWLAGQAMSVMGCAALAVMTMPVRMLQAAVKQETTNGKNEHRVDGSQQSII